jgi:hypothetical protein
VTVVLDYAFADIAWSSAFHITTCVHVMRGDTNACILARMRAHVQIDCVLMHMCIMQGHGEDHTKTTNAREIAYVSAHAHVY